MAKPIPTVRISTKLSVKEREDIADALSSARLKHTELSNEKHEYDKGMNEKLNVLDDEIQQLAESHRDKKRYTEVAVRFEPVDKSREMKVFRIDNNEFLHTRPMDEDERLEAEARERQPALPFDKTGDGSSNGKKKAPRHIKHNGQKLTLVKGGKGKGKGGKGVRP